MALNARCLVPELLDALDPADPGALRSRRDLLRLDAFLGNTRWILRSLRRTRTGVVGPIVEIGAGEGRLCARLAAAFPGAAVTGVDLVPRPARLADGIGWESGDMFTSAAVRSAKVLAGSLVLHHFDEEKLQELGGLFSNCRLAVFCEPLRSPVAYALGVLALPLVGAVTRHDMLASIRAGFRRGEIASLMLPRENGWRVRESSTWRGTLRVVAWRD